MAGIDCTKVKLCNCMVKALVETIEGTYQEIFDNFPDSGNDPELYDNLAHMDEMIKSGWACVGGLKKWIQSRRDGHID